MLQELAHHDKIVVPVLLAVNIIHNTTGTTGMDCSDRRAKHACVGGKYCTANFARKASLDGFHKVFTESNPVL